MRGRTWCVAAVGTAVCAALPASALAGTARVDQFTGGRGDETFKYVRYDARPGEANRVTGFVAFSAGGPDVATLRDSAGVTPGRGCIRPAGADAATVKCTLGAGQEQTSPQAFVHRLGDRDDTAVMDRDGRLAADIDGGSGNDVLLGGGGGGTLDEDTPGPDGNFLRGGPGNDVMNGGTRDDTFDEGSRRRNGSDTMGGGAGTDRVSYAGRRRGVRADLQGDRDDGERGERDRINADVEELAGGRAGDRLRGNSSDNVLSGNQGSDSLRGRGGNDILRAGAGRTKDVLRGEDGDDDIEGSAGRNRIYAGSGFDTVRGGGGRDRITSRDHSTDEIQCGRGRDAAVVDGLDWTDRACERIRRRGLPRLTVLSPSGGPLGGVGSNYADLTFGCPADFPVRRCQGRVTITRRGVRWGTRRLRLRRGAQDINGFVNFNRAGNTQFDALPAETEISVWVSITTRLPRGRRALVHRQVTLFRG
jgi:Ca2+-binding RTX toxin-like protein